MSRDRTFQLGWLILALAVPLATGAISAWLTSESMAEYSTMPKPPLSPPAWLFPIAWTVLYILMGVASYFVLISDVDGKTKRMALAIYCIQLLFNFCWSLIFFNLDMPMFAFIWLVIMFIEILVCTSEFYMIDRWAGYLMIPYIIWMVFAGYLNIGSYIVRR